MAKRIPVPPYLTLPDDAVRCEPAEGWILRSGGKPDQVIPDKELFPSWDGSLKFELHRQFTVATTHFAEALSLQRARAQYELIVRMETARGLFSEVLERVPINAEDEVIDVCVTPDSGRLSKDFALVTSIAIMGADGEVDVLSPSVKGARVWRDMWSSKLEGGKSRLPIEVVSFSRQLPDLRIPNALVHVSVADFPDLDFEEAVCVYLNADHSGFVADVERGRPAATAMLWDTVVRQVVGAGLSAQFLDWDQDLPPESVGAQVASWRSAIFNSETVAAVSALRRESPGVFEARIQSWVNAAAIWSESAP